MKTSVLKHKAKDNIVILRESYLKICGDIHSAILLSYFEYWHNVKVSMLSKNIQSNNIAERHGDTRTQDETLYQFHTNQEIYDECMGMISIKGIAKARKRLVELGFITEHKNPNPRYAFDNTTYFLLHDDVINSAISDIDESTISSRQIDQTVQSNRLDGHVESTRTRTETSSETTTKKEYTPSDEVKDILGFFTNECNRTHNPFNDEIKRAFNEKKWGEVIDKLMRIDGYSSFEIKDVLRFALSDDFWISNLRSLASLRNKGKNGLMKFNNIRAKMLTEQKKSSINQYKKVNFDEIREF